MVMRGHYPLLFTVTLRRTRPGGVDAFGNPTMVFEDMPLRAFGWTFGGFELSDQTGVNRVEYDAVLYADLSPDVDPLDRIQLEPDGQWFEVAKPPENYEHNPWFCPGLCVVYLNKVEG